MAEWYGVGLRPPSFESWEVVEDLPNGDKILRHEYDRQVWYIVQYPSGGHSRRCGTREAALTESSAGLRIGRA